jgi:monofunctional biosynthetic peptidoglycan transglycosylase
MGESRTPVETRRYRVAGLSDAEGALRAEHALLSVPGVHRAIVDYDHQQVIVRIANYVTDDAIAEAVEGVGYTLLLETRPRIRNDEELNERPAPDEVPEDTPAPEEPDPEPEPVRPPEAPRPRDDTRDWERPARAEPLPLWRRIWFFASRTVVYGILFTVVLTLVYRVLPVPTTMLILSEGLLEGRAIRKDWVPLEQISPNLVRSVIASEDNEFCRHWGFDFKEMEDAWKDSKRGGRLRGASTISQQTAKNVFLWSGRSWIRKGMEAYFTLMIEGLWPKRRIMEVYLNVIEWGPGVFGAEAAARRWFGKSASKLTRLEAARLAAILPSPKRYRANPPGPYVNDRGYTISARASNVDLNGVDRCAKP